MQYDRDNSVVKANHKDYKITSAITTAAAALEGQSNGLQAACGLNVTLQAEVLWRFSKCPSQLLAFVASARTR